jgi:mycobactin peptide synthetase MbtE
VELTVTRAESEGDPLVAAFSEALGGMPVDPEASLFDLGGTSLAVVRLCKALSRLTGLSMPLSAVFSHPSVNEMRAWIVEQSAPAPDGADRAASSSPLTGMQAGFLFQHADGEDVHNNASSAWRIAGPLDIDRFVEALQDVHCRHAYLQGCYTFVDKAMWIRSERPVPVEYIEAPDEETALRRLQEALQEPFSLSTGDVWRVVLCTLADCDQWLFGMSVHHIAFDGWSQRIFVEDLAEAYRARCGGRDARFARLVEPPSAIYAEMERIRGLADLARQLGYWEKELAGLPVGPAPWITSLPGKDVGVKTIEVRLTAEQADLVHRHSAGSGLLPTFVAALGGALADTAGAEDLTIGVPISQRSTPVLQDTIACLINTMCIRLQATTAHDFTTQAERAVLAGLRNSVPSIAEVARSAGLVGRPLFQVVAAVQDSPSPELWLDGCTADLLELPDTQLGAPMVVDLFADDGIASTLQVVYDSALVAETMARNVSAGLVGRLTRAGG